MTAKGAKATLLTDAGLFGNSKCMLCFECLYVNPKGNKVFVWSVGFLLAWEVSDNNVAGTLYWLQTLQ